MMQANRIIQKPIDARVRQVVNILTCQAACWCGYPVGADADGYANGY